MLQGLMVVAALSCGQWSDSEADKKLWLDSGAPWIDGLRFYDVPKVSQRLVGIVNYNPENRFGIFLDTWRGFDRRSDNVNAMMPWATPSGLHNSPKSQWRKVAGAYFPGKVKVSVETVIVQNSIRDPRGGFFKQPQPQVQWTFPDGTMFSEMLIRTGVGREYAFEIRTYRISGGKMTDGETYRPDVSKHSPVSLSVEPGKLSDFGFSSAKVKLWRTSEKAGPVLLTLQRESLTSETNDGIVPKGFLGTNRTCVDCHAQAGKPTSYGSTTIRGSNNNISWHPFLENTINSDADPIIDKRWPVEVLSRRLQSR